jgi:hypothetical protein
MCGSYSTWLKKSKLSSPHGAAQRATRAEIAPAHELKDRPASCR